jgi:hypothetical protein
VAKKKAPPRGRWSVKRGPGRKIQWFVRDGAGKHVGTFAERDTAEKWARAKVRLSGGEQLALEPRAAPKRKPATKRKGRRSTAPELSSLRSRIVESRVAGGTRLYADRWSMQLEYVDCGRCPKAHGPYWYAYKRGAVDYSQPVGTPGKLFKVYVGKTYDVDAARKKLQAVGACR